VLEGDGVACASARGRGVQSRPTSLVGGEGHTARSRRGEQAARGAGGGRREAPRRVAARGCGGTGARSTMLNMVDRCRRRFPRRTRLAGVSGPGPSNLVLVVHGVSDGVNSRYRSKLRI
jgi:hypothetical protein